MSGLMGARMNVSCPICGTGLYPTLEDVRMERTILCPRGHQVKLVDQGDGVRNFDRQFDDFARKMRRAGFKVTFKRR